MFSPPPPDNFSSDAAAAYEQLEKRIKALETEIPFYSSKAAELMVQRTDDNTYKIETERRLEELATLREQIKRIPLNNGGVRSTPQTPAATTLQPPPPPVTASAAPTPSPTISTPLIPAASLPPQLPPPPPPPIAAAAAVATSPLQATSAPSSRMPYASNSGGSATSLSEMARQSGSGSFNQHHHSQQQQQPALSRKETAIALAKKRASVYSLPIEAIFLSSHYLDYNDMISMCCVSKLFKSRIKRSPGWRRIVIGLEATLRGHVGKITALTWFDTAIVTGGADGKIKFWDKNYSCFKTNNITPTPAHRFIHPKVKELQRGTASNHHYSSQFGGGATTAAAAASSTEDEYPEFALAVTSLLTLDQKTILIGSEDGRLIVWITTEKRDADCYVFNSSLTCMTLNHELVFLGSAEGRVAVMSRRINLSSPYATLTRDYFHYGNKQHETSVTALAFAGSYMFSGSASGRIFVWRVGNSGTGEVALEYKGVLVHQALQADGTVVSEEHTDRITALAGSSERLFSASWDCTIKQWNPVTLELLREVNVLPLGICWSLVIRRDQKPYSLVAGVRDNDLCVMDFETLEVLSSCSAFHWTSKLNQHTSWVKTLFAHPDGRILSGGSDDWTVKVWSARGRCIQTPQPYIFFGLPRGPINKEDLDILLSKSGSKYTPQHLQDSKQEFDRACYASDLSAEQKAEYQFQAVKQQEAWEKYRTEKRKKDTTAAAAAAASTTSTADGTTAVEEKPEDVDAKPNDAAAPKPAPSTEAEAVATPARSEESQNLDLGGGEEEEERVRMLSRQDSILSQQVAAGNMTSPMTAPTPPPAQQSGDDDALLASGDELQASGGGGSTTQDDLLAEDSSDDKAGDNHTLDEDDHASKRMRPTITEDNNDDQLDDLDIVGGADED